MPGLLHAIKGATLTEWRMDTSGYSETRFDNGVIVYTNPTDMVVETPDGPLEPMQFMFTTGGDRQCRLESDPKALNF